MKINIKKIKNLKGKSLTIAILAVISVVLALFIVYLSFFKGVEGWALSPNKAAEKVIRYVNENILQGMIEATNEGKIESAGCLYKIQIKVGEEKFDSYATKDGKIFFPQVIRIDESQKDSTKGKTTTVGSFSRNENEVCKENGKPIVYFFGSTSCPHCQWEHPIIERAAEKFKDQISFHNNMDNDADGEVFAEYSSGGVPTIVLGCKYSRVGSGEQMGEEEEEKVLTALICDLTGSQPAGTCGEVKDLIDQINE